MANRYLSDSGNEPGSHRPGADARTHAAERRDAAMARIGSARRWVITAAVGLSAGFAALVYALAPGHSLSSARAATPEQTGTTSSVPSDQPAMPAPAGPAALGLGGSSGSSAGSSSGSSQSAPAPATSAPAPAASAPASSGPPATSGGS